MSFAKGSDEKTVSWEIYLVTIIATLGSFFVGLLVAVKLRSFFEMRIDDMRSSLFFAVQLIPYFFGSAALLACLKFLHHRPVRSFFTSRKSFDWQRFFFAFGLWLLIQVVFMLTAKASGAPIVFDFSLGNLLPLLLISVTLLPIQTAFEDVLYRGYLFKAITRSTGKAGLSVLVVALIFGWMHSGNPEVEVFGYGVLTFYIVSGLFLGLLTHLDDGLELGMGYHFANNFFGAVILTNSWQVFQTYAFFTDHSQPQFGWETWIPLMTIQPALLYVFYRVYRWKTPIKRILE